MASRRGSEGFDKTAASVFLASGITRVVFAPATHLNYWEAKP
jgi:hypothetical protein